jgi:putative membrane protein
LSDLKGLAQSKTISLPDSATKDAMDAYMKLEEQKGAEFDKKYCDMMVDGHKDAIDKFEKAAADASDPQIKQWASSMIPDLRKHLDQAMTCQNKMKK